MNLMYGLAVERRPVPGTQLVVNKCQSQLSPSQRYISKEHPLDPSVLESSFEHVSPCLSLHFLAGLFPLRRNQCCLPHISFSLNPHVFLNKLPYRSSCFPHTKHLSAWLCEVTGSEISIVVLSWRLEGKAKGRMGRPD